MARISGVNVPDAKRVEVALDLYIWHWHNHQSQDFRDHRSPQTQGSTPLTEADISKLREVIDKNYRVEGDLQREVGFEHQAFEGN